MRRPCLTRYVKRELRRILTLTLIGSLLCGCGSETSESISENPTDKTTTHIEAKVSSISPPKAKLLSPEEQRQALDEILTNLDKARERSGLDENSSTATFGSLNYPNGGKYVGSFKDGKRHGLGSFVFPNGDRFRGYYEKGKRQGYGVYEFTSRERYEGYFHNGKYHHWGLYLFKNGDKYFGQYQHGRRQGRGTLTKKSGERYEGDFSDGKRQGFGACIFADGSRYSGTWEDDEPEGWGTYVHPSQDQPNPSSKSGNPSASTAEGLHDLSTGIPTSPNIISAVSANDLQVTASSIDPTGETLSSLTEIDALPTNTLPQGEPLTMANQNDEIESGNGDGFLDFENGDRYAGQLLAGQPHGQGAYLFANGERYLGDFRHGDYHGQGLFTFADGKRYLGQWSEGRFHGHGILYDPNGKIAKEGKWQAGKPRD